MNLRKFWIGTGAITTFVVGVSLVAYATGKFTSEASPLTTLSETQNTINTQGTAVQNAFSATQSATNTSVNPNTPGSSAAEATGQTSSVSTTLPASDALNSGVGTATNTQTSTTTGTTTPAPNAANAKTAAPAAAKTLTTIKTAEPVELQNFLQKNFLSVDSILRIGIPRLLVSFAGLVTLIIFLINAVKFLFGAGNEKATTEAKQGMAFAGIGFAIVIFAYLIVSFAASIFK